MTKVLITGGAGYIGSHVVKLLGEKGYEILTYDNLSTGHEWAVLYGDLVKADLSDKETLMEVFSGFKPDAVMHFAAHIVVPESVKHPLKYYRNNVTNTLNLLEIMEQSGVKILIYSSSAAVYGIPEDVPVPETSPLNPINPYGETKATVEKMLRNLSNSGSAFRYISLRYFNVAGADPGGRIGEMHNPETHLIPLVLKAIKNGGYVKIYGTDYPTPDGTCIRDYIHVMDLAQAHVMALENLLDGGESEVFNCGYGHGFSVMEVVDTIRKITGREFKVLEYPRRPGDAPVLVADNTKIKEKLGWKPRFDDLQYIIKTAWQWELNV